MAGRDETRRNVIEEHAGKDSVPVGSSGRVRAHPDAGAGTGAGAGDYEPALDPSSHGGLTAAEDPDPSGRAAAGQIHTTTRHTEGTAELAGATGPAGEKPAAELAPGASSGPVVIDFSAWTGDAGGDSKAPTEALGLFGGRDELEQAMEALESNGFDRAQLSLLGAEDTLAKLRDTHGAGEFADVQSDRAEPVKRDEEGSLTGMMAGIPTYAGAVIAAGLTVASGGAVGIAALAALGGAAGGAALGAGAGFMFSEAVQAEYDERLTQGGIILAVRLREDIEAERATALMAPYAIRTDIR